MGRIIARLESGARELSTERRDEWLCTRCRAHSTLAVLKTPSGQTSKLLSGFVLHLQVFALPIHPSRPL